MKIKTTHILFFLSFFQICVSQNIKGKIIGDSLPIADVEVINTTTKDVVNSNSDGSFEIKANIGNWVTFYHKDYDVVKIYVDSLFDFNKSLDVKLYIKSTKIEEVVVEKKQPFLKGLGVGMPVIPYNKPSVQFNDGSIPNGINFIAVGKMLIGLFKNKDKMEYKEKVPVQFRAFTSQSYSNDFLMTSLKLKPDEIESFLNFCSFDPMSSEAVQKSDKMALLQFLIAKSEEYKKVYRNE